MTAMADTELPERYWTAHASLTLDFCVWALQGDGLKVPPFVVHGEGDQQLRRRGMDARQWTRWLGRVAQADRFLQVAGTAPLRKLSQMDRFAVLPFRLAQGNGKIRAYLEELWWAYLPEGRAWLVRRSGAGSLAKGNRPVLTPATRRRLQATFAPLRDASDCLRVMFVNYPFFVSGCLPPNVVVIGAPDEPELDQRVYTALLERGLSELLDASG